MDLFLRQGTIVPFVMRGRENFSLHTAMGRVTEEVLDCLPEASVAASRAVGHSNAEEIGVRECYVEPHAAQKCCFRSWYLAEHRVCRRGYNLWRRALVYKFTGVSLCQRISSRASERSLVAASVLYSGISIQWTPSWTYRAASSELSLAWRNSAVTLCPLIDDDVPVVECVVGT